MDKDLAKDFPEKKEDDKEDEIEMKKEVCIYILYIFLNYVIHRWPPLRQCFLRLDCKRQ